MAQAYIQMIREANHFIYIENQVRREVLQVKMWSLTVRLAVLRVMAIPEVACQEWYCCSPCAAYTASR